MRPYNPVGDPLIVLDEVDSTNNYAMAQVQAQLAAHGFSYFARHQKLGKGQRGKRWNADPNDNITISFVLEPAGVKLQDQFMVSVAVALGCLDFFKLHAGDETSLKWPNDIYWRDRKAGGILIENLLQGNSWKYAIAGVGININQVQFPVELRKAVSLKQITGKSFDVVELAKQLSNHLNNRWNQLSDFGYDGLLEDYNKHLFKLNEPITFKKENAEFTAVVKGVNGSGELIIDTGTISYLPFGSVEWVL